MAQLTEDDDACKNDNLFKVTETKYHKLGVEQEKLQQKQKENNQNSSNDKKK